MIRRDNEEELIFRGNQYARAINQYQRKFANASPRDLDVLIEQRMLRKKFRDPLSPDKDGAFQLLYVNTQSPGSRGAGAGSATGSTLGTTPSGGISGVASKNTGESLRVFNGKTHYNEWQFVGMQQSATPGAGAGAGGRGGVGGPGAGGRGAGSQRGDARGPMDGLGPSRGGPPQPRGRGPF